MSGEDLDRAYRHTSRHRTELTASELCGCFYCLETFPPTAIVRWLSEGDGTALCPKCTIDSVIGDASGFPITHEFLKRMNARWF
jgi:hypothetical protein